jgi:hypothetical protein
MFLLHHLLHTPSASKCADFLTLPPPFARLSSRDFHIPFGLIPFLSDGSPQGSNHVGIAPVLTDTGLASGT